MLDVLFIGIVIAFFAICAAYVSACSRLVGDGDIGRDALASHDGAQAAERVTT